jgi:uncharacterized repeat protein (TIGR01451 family)
MNRNWRTPICAAAGAALIIALLAAPGVWATPGQNTVNQTIPTRTPTAAPATPEPPTPEPPTAQPPPPTPDPGAPATVAPTAPVPAPTRTAVPAASPLALTLVADRQSVWPGATVTFTLTVTNTGPAALRQVTVTDLLAEGLAPGEVISGEATWDGNTLRATIPSLLPGAKLALVYTATVTATAPGQAIVTRANATAAGGAQAAASLTLGLPPSELPATGGCLEP